MTGPEDGKWLRDAWRALAAEKADGTSPVGDEAIWRAVAGEGGAEERHAVIDVVARDPAAAESWRLAQELQRELAEREPSWRNRQQGERPVVTALWRRRPLQWAAMAAMLLLVPGLGWWHLREPSDGGTDEQGYRDSPAAQLLNQVPEDVPQPRDQVILSWSDEASGTPDGGTPDIGTSYTVVVMNSDFETLVALRELTSLSVRLSAEALRGVATGESLRWQVEARRADGQIVTSPTFFLTLAPASNGSTLSDQPHLEQEP